MPNRKLENSKQRLAPARLTHGNVGDSPDPEITPPRLDCLARPERFELLNPETRGKRWGDWCLIFIAERSGVVRPSVTGRASTAQPSVRTPASETRPSVVLPASPARSSTPGSASTTLFSRVPLISPENPSSNGAATS